MKKSSIEKRVNLQPVLIDMQKYSIVTRKFAKVLTGEVQEIGLGYPQRQTAKLYGVTMRTKIVLQRHFALHMDNSGHFTGKKYGKNGHGDKYPLTLEEITNIPKIVKTARADEIFGIGWQRGAQRFKIARKTSRHQTVVIEISRSKNRINIVTAYNLTASQYKNLTKKSDTLTIESVC